MEIQIFKDLTTEDIIAGLEVESKKYEGLYVDMNNAPERKYVKEKAALISDILKKLDRARIDKSKEYKILVESEAKNIKQRLEAANLPFTALIDKHKQERAEALAKEKAEREARDLAIQKEADHEAAIMEDKVRAFEKAEAERLEKESIEQQKAEAARIAKENSEREAREAIEKAEAQSLAAIQREIDAKKQAEESEKLRIEAVERQRINDELAEERRIAAERQARIDAAQAAENARLEEIERQKREVQRLADEQAAREADKKHRGAVNRSIVEVLISNGITEEDAKMMVTLAAKKKLPNLIINY